METRHSINGLVEILNWMVHQGFEKKALLKGINVNAARLSDPKATLSRQEELSFYRNLLSVSGDSLIMIKAGFNLKISTYGIWGLALLSSPTFGKAIELGLQYIDFTYTFNKITFFQDNEQSGLSLKKLSELGDLQERMIERDIAAVFVLFQALLQVQNPLTEIRLAWVPKQPVEDYSSLFSCPVIVGCCESEVRFSTELLGHALAQNNALTLQLCTQQLEEIRPEIQVGNSFTDQVNHYFLRTPLYHVNLESCAEELAVNTRQLRRKLSAEETSFQTLLDNFRFILADKYLSKTDIILDEIAIRLGYSDAANFSHAYKRWTGVSPRKSQQDVYSKAILSNLNDIKSKLGNE